MPGIVELISTLGDDKLEVQRLESCMTHIRTRPTHSAITIRTEAVTDYSICNSSGETPALNKTALIVWVDKRDLEQAFEHIAHSDSSLGGPCEPKAE